MDSLNKCPGFPDGHGALWGAMIRASHRLLALALFLGLSIAAVATLTVDCRSRPSYVLTNKWRPASAVSSSATCRWSLGECRALRRSDHRPGQGPGHRVGLSLPGFSLSIVNKINVVLSAVTGGAVENKRLDFEPIITIIEETMRQTIVARGFKLKASRRSAASSSRSGLLAPTGQRSRAGSRGW